MQNYIRFSFQNIMSFFEIAVAAFSLSGFYPSFFEIPAQIVPCGCEWVNNVYLLCKMSSLSACSEWINCKQQISSLANSIRVLANMEDPIGHVLKRTQVSKGDCNYIFTNIPMSKVETY